MTPGNSGATERLVASAERIDAGLKLIGCPYTALDTRSDTWLDGYQAGLRFAGNPALRAHGEAK